MKEHRGTILQWLEIESNFNWLNGEATKGMKMVVTGATRLMKSINLYCGIELNDRIPENRIEILAILSGNI